MKKAFLLLIRFYQLSRPLRPASCRFYPSCSSYAHEAIHRHGILGGMLLSFFRLCRCHPFHSGGVDEVPELYKIGSFLGLPSKQV